MIITRETPLNEGLSVEEGGTLLDLADVTDVDGTGAKVKPAMALSGAPLVQLIVDSISYPSKSVHLEPQDAIHLAACLLLEATRALQAPRG